MKYLIRVLGLVLIIELILLFTGIVPINVAAVLIVITEVTAFILGGSLIITIIRTIYSKVKKGEKVYYVFESSFKDAMPPKVLFLVKHEVGIFASLARLLRWKKDVPEGAIEIRYGQQMRQLLAVLLVIGVIEIVAVGMLIPWFEVRLAVLLISIYGMIWLIGFFGATLMYPHYVDGDKLVIRFLHTQTIRIPLDIVSDFGAANKEATINKTSFIDDDTLFLNVMGCTNMYVNVADSSKIMQNYEPLETVVKRVRFFVDDFGDTSEAIKGSQLLDIAKGHSTS